MSTILTALAVVAAVTPGLLVSPAELASALKDPTIVVVAVGNSEDDFIAGHIRNARFVRYDQIAIDVDGLQSELPPVEQLRSVLAAIGISDASKVVIYGSPIVATRMLFTLDYVKGHLPGARQLVWNSLLDASGKFLPDAELRKKFDAIGANAQTPLVSYCMIGMRASVTYFIARHLGYDARMYDGSIVDWTRRKLPAVTGKE